MSYDIQIQRSAQKSLAKVPSNFQKEIISAIRKLASDARPAGCKKLSGRPGWRIRIGSYRVIYEIHEQQLVITVVIISHRKNVYLNRS